MATIDKPLPNISETVVEIPKQEELVEAREEITRLIEKSRVICHNCWIKLDNDLIELL